MPIGYGYQERGDAGYVNWAAVTKGFTDVLDADIKDKKRREQEYEDQDRKIGQTLDDMPLGQFEDGNTFTGNAVDMIKKQKLMDYKLWRAGKLSDKQYTLKQNNMTDNINTLFDLQKTYQAEAEKRMKGLQDQSLQPLTANNMAMIEGFSNFKDSVPMIDPQTNVVSIVRKVYDEKTKTWNIDKTKSMPVKMAMGLIMKPADAFKVNEQIDQDVARMGSLKDSLYKAATKYGAGSIEELIGPEGFTKYPGAKGVIENYNKAINQQIESYLTPGLNLTSVLTMQVGGYNANSFTYDKAEAAKDPSKILMKIDPTSKYPTIDETGPNFKKQKEQAADWIKTQFMSRIDRERNIQAATGQLSDVGFQRQVYGEQKKEEKLDAATFGKNLARYATGTPEEASAASSYLTRLNIPNYKDEDGTIHIMFKGQDIPYDPKKVDTNKYLESLVAAGNEFFTANSIRQGDVVAAAKAEAKGKKYSTGAVGSKKATETEKDYKQEFGKITNSIPIDVFGYKEGSVVSKLAPILAPLNVKITPSGGSMSNWVTFTAPGKTPIRIAANKYSSEGENSEFKKLNDWLNESFPDDKSIKEAMDAANVKATPNPDQAP